MSKYRKSFKPLTSQTVAETMENNPPKMENEKTTDVQVCGEAIRGKLPEIVTLQNRIEYDSLNPEEKIRSFLAFARRVTIRYEENQRMIEAYQQQTQDVLHKIELSENLDAPGGFKMYKLLRDIRRERRKCKNECDLLKPVFDYLQAHPEMEGQMAQIQGKCKNLKTGIDSRQYTLRTGVFDHGA